MAPRYAALVLAIAIIAAIPFLAGRDDRASPAAVRNRPPEQRAVAAATPGHDAAGGGIAAGRSGPAANGAAEGHSGAAAPWRRELDAVDAALTAAAAAPDPIAAAPALAKQMRETAAGIAGAAALGPASPRPEPAAKAALLGSASDALAAAGTLDQGALAVALLSLQGISATTGPADAAAALASRLPAAVDAALARLRDRYLTPLAGGRVAYLTFDDGPGQLVTLRVLDVLAAERVPATFFVLGQQSKRHPELVQRAQAAGHAVGNHTYNHHYPDIYPQPEKFLACLQRTEAVLTPLLGHSTRLVRAPGGSYNKFERRHLWLLEAAGYVAFDWNIDSEDAKGASTADAIVARVTAQAEGKAPAVVLLHDADGKSATAEALPRLIDHFRRRGYAFATLDPDGPGLAQAAARLLGRPPGISPG